jgi:hypothetical protein
MRVFPDRTVVGFVQIDVGHARHRETGPQDARRVCMRDYAQRVASWVDGRYQFALAIGSKSETGTNVFLRQVRKVVKDFLL